MKTIQELKTELKELGQKYWALKSQKTKTAKALSERMSLIKGELRDQFRELAAQYEGQVVEVRVTHNNLVNSRHSALGFIESLNEAIELNPCNAVNSASWYNETCCVSFERDSIVKVVLKAAYSDQGITLAAARIEGGIFHKDEYKRLKSTKNLAFFKYDLDINEVSGLVV